MTIETLKERIANAEATIAKKQNTIVKKTALIEKKRAALEKQTGNDAYWTECEIDTLTEDIERNGKEIAAIRKTLEGYREQMTGAQEQEKLLDDIPENLKALQAEIVTRWDDYDKRQREARHSEYSELGYTKFCRKYGYTAYDNLFLTDEQIHRRNVNDAKALILNLIYRVRDIAGEITDWSGITCAQGNFFEGAALNGVIIGKKGCCEVESIFAGGWNIQRLHIRVLVKKIA